MAAELRLAAHTAAERRRPFSNDPHLVLRFVERGLGIAFLPWTLVATPITRGDLVTVLPKLLRLEGSISIVYAERKLMPPQVRAFVDWMTERAPAALGSANAADLAMRRN